MGEGTKDFALEDEVVNFVLVSFDGMSRGSFFTPLPVCASPEPAKVTRFVMTKISLSFAVGGLNPMP
jgi:hypothetical protein